MLAPCSNLACTASTTTVVDSTPTDDGQVSTVAIGADGFPVISYFNNTNVNLKVAKCSNPFCVPHFFR